MLAKFTATLMLAKFTKQKQHRDDRQADPSVDTALQAPDENKVPTGKPNLQESETQVR
jgi:hypothetical protein